MIISLSSVGKNSQQVKVIIWTSVPKKQETTNISIIYHVYCSYGKRYRLSEGSVLAGCCRHCSFINWYHLTRHSLSQPLENGCSLKITICLVLYGYLTFLSKKTVLWFGSEKKISNFFNNILKSHNWLKMKILLNFLWGIIAHKI